MQAPEQNKIKINTEAKSKKPHNYLLIRSYLKYHFTIKNKPVLFTGLFSFLSFFLWFKMLFTLVIVYQLFMVL